MARPGFAAGEQQVVNVTIPAGNCTITYGIQGGGGSMLGGAGAVNSGTLTCDNAASLELTLVAGGGGTNGNPERVLHLAWRVGRPKPRS